MSPSSPARYSREAWQGAVEKHLLRAQRHTVPHRERRTRGEHHPVWDFLFDYYPLRLGRDGTDRVVESHQLKCSHFDAYRFFTPAAAPLNLTVLDRESQAEHDQPGCLHVAMDLYKWAAKMGPVVPGDLLLDAFELAAEARRLDMEASPYDCRGLGFGVVPVETAAGKAAYVARQRRLAAAAEPIRARLVALLRDLLNR